jgi:hypothetical protein
MATNTRDVYGVLPGGGRMDLRDTTVTRPAVHVSGNRFGARAMAVRATEVDAMIQEGGASKTLTFARALAPNAIANDPLLLTVTGDSISNYTRGQRRAVALRQSRGCCEPHGLGRCRMNHDGKGGFVSGNTAALIHGGRSRQVQAGTLAAQAEAVAATAESMAVLVNDLSGTDEISQVQRDLVTSYLRLGLIEEFAYRSLEAGGVFTAHGKQRAAVQTLKKAIAQRQDIARTLGLKRKQKTVPELSRYLAERERA